MCQYAVSVYNIPLKKLIEKFINSKLAWGIENALPYYMVHRAGIEMLQFLYLEIELVEFGVDYGREFWIGWAMSYLQWYSGLTFKELLRIVPVERFENMYYAYHEMDDEHLRTFSDKFITKKGKF